MDHWADYVIFVLFIGISIGIGVYHACTGGKQKTPEEFILNDRQLKLIPTALSLLVSYQSAIMVIGNTAEVYVGGIMQWPWSTLAGSLAIFLTAQLVVPWLYPLRLTSVFKYFRMRYGTRDVQIYAAVNDIIAMVFYMASATFACSVALETATDFPMTAAIPIMLVVCVFYTALGGMRAVVWTDVFQFIVMFGGILAVLIKSIIMSDGVARSFDIARNQSRMDWTNISPDFTERHTVWGFVFGFTCNWIRMYGIKQASAQRYFSLKCLQSAKRSLFLSIPLVMMMYIITFLTGLAVFTYYFDIKCDPITSGAIKGPNQLLPLFVKTVFQKNRGFSGFFLATLYSGALSSVSSCLSGSAAVAWDDIASVKLSHLSPAKATLINRLFVVSFGAIAIGLTFFIATVPGPIVQVTLSFSSAVSGPLIGVFLISGIKSLKWIHPKGVLTGGLLGIAFMFWLCLGATSLNNKYPRFPSLPVDNCSSAVNVTDSKYIPHTGLNKFYSISYLWFGLIGCVITFMTGLLSALFIRYILKYEVRKDIPDFLFINFHNLWRNGEMKPIPLEVLEQAKNYTGKYPVVMSTKANDQSEKSEQNELRPMIVDGNKL